MGFKHGQYLNYAGDNPQGGAWTGGREPWQKEITREDIPLSNVFVAMLQRLGVETDEPRFPWRPYGECSVAYSSWCGRWNLTQACDPVLELETGKLCWSFASELQRGSALAVDGKSIL